MRRLNSNLSCRLLLTAMLSSMSTIIVFSQDSFAASLPCAEIFPKPLENGCQFERCGARIQSVVTKKTFLFSQPSRSAEKVQPLAPTEPPFTKLDFKFQWIRMGMVRAFRDFTAAEKHASWKKGDEFGFFEHESEGLTYSACIGRERIPFQTLHETAPECPVGGICLGMISYPAIKVWVHAKLKNGKSGWIDSDDLDVMD